MLARQFGNKPLQWLTQHMLRSNMSVQAFVQALKLCLLQFYSAAPLSSLAVLGRSGAAVAASSELRKQQPDDADPALWRACASLVENLSDDVRLTVIFVRFTKDSSVLIVFVDCADGCDGESVAVDELRITWTYIVIHTIGPCRQDQQQGKLIWRCHSRRLQGTL